MWLICAETLGVSNPLPKPRQQLRRQSQHLILQCRVSCCWFILKLWVSKIHFQRKWKDLWRPQPYWLSVKTVFCLWQQHVCFFRTLEFETQILMLRSVRENLGKGSLPVVVEEPYLKFLSPSVLHNSIGDRSTIPDTALYVWAANHMLISAQFGFCLIVILSHRLLIWSFWSCLLQCPVLHDDNSRGLSFVWWFSPHLAFFAYRWGSWAWNGRLKRRPSLQGHILLLPRMSEDGRAILRKTLLDRQTYILLRLVKDAPFTHFSLLAWKIQSSTASLECCVQPK